MPDATPIACSSPVEAMEAFISTFDGENVDEYGSLSTLDGTYVPWQTAGATVVDGTDHPFEGEVDALIFSISLHGVVRHITTAPFPVGPNYSNRTPGPSDSVLGQINFVTTDTGAVYVELHRVNETGSTSTYRWRFDDPCDRTLPGNAAASAAEAVEGAPAFTG